MARYKVLLRSFIGNEIKEAGSEVELSGKPGSNLEYISGERYKGPDKSPTQKSPAEQKVTELEKELDLAKRKIALLSAPSVEDAAPPAEEDEGSDDLG